jgi:hypothetical protein
MNDAQLLRALEDEIPVLEERLKAMKVTRKRLRAAEAMRAKRRDPAFNARMVAACRGRWDSPEEQARFAAVRHNGNPLPWSQRSGAPEYAAYRALRRKGWTRELAIDKINAEGAT